MFKYNTSDTDFSNKVVTIISGIYPEFWKVINVDSSFPKFNLRILHNDYYVDGSFYGHSFGVYDNRNNLVASISKKYISWGDTYEIDVQDENNLEVLLFMVIIIDQVIHEKKRN